MQHQTIPPLAQTGVKAFGRPDSIRAGGRTAWFTGLSGAGKSTLTQALAVRMSHYGLPTCIVDGDDLRLGLNRDLGFSLEDRSENVRRAAEVARLLNKQGVFVAVALISPLAEHRSVARRIVGDENFYEIYVKCDVRTCASRDVKGLYARALRGEIAEFTGISSPYDEPEAPDLRIDTAVDCVSKGVDDLCGLLLGEPRRASLHRA